MKISTGSNKYEKHFKINLCILVNTQVINGNAVHTEKFLIVIIVSMYK